MNNGNGNAMDHAEQIALRILAQEIQVGFGRLGINPRGSSVTRLEENLSEALNRVNPQRTREGEAALGQMMAGVETVKKPYFPVFASQAINGEIGRNLALVMTMDGRERSAWAEIVDHFAALVAVSGVKFEGPFGQETALAYLRGLPTEKIAHLKKTNEGCLMAACRFAGIEFFNLVSERFTTTATKAGTGKLVTSASGNLA